jgi:tRNA threonylcarbamoyladenosine modification (KEOPS) complex  Pcc1 subunit
MSNRVARVLYRSILKEIRGLTLTRGRRVLLLEEPDRKKWGHGQVT